MFSYPLTYRKRDIASLPEFSVVDVETTGFSPYRGDRIVEIAIVRIDAYGHQRGTFQTLINPERDTGPSWIHRISNDMAKAAPTFAEVAPAVLAWLSGTVVVAHNASFEDRFLEWEFAQMQTPVPELAALDTLDLARSALQLPNYRLSTVTRSAGIELHNAHSAYGDAVATAQLVPFLLQHLGRMPTWELSPPQLQGHTDCPYHPRPEEGSDLSRGLKRGTDGWIANLLARMPEHDNDLSDQAGAYYELVCKVIADGKIVGDEARALARMAGSIGLSRTQAAAMHKRALDDMRDVALSDGRLTHQEYQLLCKAAQQLDQVGYFSDLADVVR